MKIYISKDKNMTDKKVFLSKELKKMVTKILGPYIVSKCYYVVYDFGIKTENSLELQNTKNNIRLKDNSLNYSGQDILIEFTNGTKVLFTNSEWASMKKIKGELYENKRD